MTERPHALDPAARRRRAAPAGASGPPEEPVRRILVTASSPLIRAGLRALLAGEPAIVVVDVAALDESLGQHISDVAPDAIVAAVDADEHDALPTLLSGVADAAPPVVVLSNEPQVLWAAAGGRGDVRAVLPRDANAAEIVAAIAGAAAGLVVLHPSALGASPPAARDPALTARESEVLGMLAEGHANKTVAWRLGISEHTVKFHVASIFEKLGASTRTEAVTTAIRRGLLLL